MLFQILPAIFVLWLFFPWLTGSAHPPPVAAAGRSSGTPRGPKVGNVYDSRGFMLLYVINTYLVNTERERMIWWIH